MNNIKNINITILSGDHFASNIKLELETMNQSVYILQHKNRFDLFLISIMKKEQLSSEAIDVKNIIMFKNYNNVNNVNKINIADLNNEIERISDINDFIPNNIFINLPFPKTLLSVKLIEIRNYISTSIYFNNIKNSIKSKDIYLTSLGSLTDELKKFFGVKTWFQLFTTCKFILEKELNIIMVKISNGYVAKYKTDEQSTHLLQHDDLRKYWLNNWNDSLIDFCLTFNIKVKDFASWVTGKSVTDSSCSTAVKQYILDSSS